MKWPASAAATVSSTSSGLSTRPSPNTASSSTCSAATATTSAGSISHDAAPCVGAACSDARKNAPLAARVQYSAATTISVSGAISIDIARHSAATAPRRMPRLPAAPSAAGRGGELDMTSDQTPAA